MENFTGHHQVFGDLCEIFRHFWRFRRFRRIDLALAPLMTILQVKIGASVLKGSMPVNYT